MQASPLVLGRYAVYDKIAQGGMASVHLGRLLGPVGFARTVAIKRLHPNFAGDPEFVAMFMDEARLAARISHPNVVPTLDVVATEGELFLVMEYVRGEALSRLFRAARRLGEPVPLPIVASIMVGALSGLHAAHEATNERGESLGIVHRDVSPQNVLVGVDGTARVLDFGVAKAVGRTHTTRDGQLKGKLAYMAPEQIRGKVTRETDVYSASIVLWEALVGERLFPADNELELLDKVTRGRRDPPSARNPMVPPAIDEIVLRGLAIEPEQRFPTARAMARALEDAVTPASASRVGEWVERLVHDVLVERTQLISRIESDTISLVTPTSTPTPSPNPSPNPSPTPNPAPAPNPTPTSAPTPHDEVGEPITQLSSGEYSAATPPRTRRLLAPVLAIAGAALLILVAAGAIALRRTSATSQATVVPTASAPPPASTAPVASAAPVVSAAPVMSAAPVVSAEPVVTAEPTHHEPPPIATHATAAATATHHAPAPTARPDPCKPPYFIDSRGVKVFKTECL